VIIRTISVVIRKYYIGVYSQNTLGHLSRKPVKKSYSKPEKVDTIVDNDGVEFDFDDI